MKEAASEENKSTHSSKGRRLLQKPIVSHRRGSFQIQGRRSSHFCRNARKGRSSIVPLSEVMRETASAENSVV